MYTVRPTYVIAILAVLSTVDAQNRVLPPANSTVEGAHTTEFPFANSGGRTQQIWLGSAVAPTLAMINGIRFRRDVNISGKAYTSQTYPAATVSAGATSLAPDAMAAVFATNTTGKMTKLLNAARLNLPPLQASTKAPANFNIPISWSTPYLFSPGPASHLLLDISLPGANSLTPYHVDAQAAPSGGPRGSVTSYGTNGRFSGRELYSLTADPMALFAGGQLNIRCGAFNSGYTGNLILGFSDKTWGGAALPLSLGILGAPNNNLYTSVDLTFPFNAVRNGATHQSNFIAPIPKDPKAQGLKFFAQAYYLDAAANAAGLVVSHGLALTTANRTILTPITQQIHHADYRSSGGKYAFGPGANGGPVVEMIGYFL